MITTTAQLINSLPNIEDKHYLELGIAGGWTFDNIKCKKKIGVDIQEDTKANYIMTTDDFFEVYSGNIFDVIYIDANHSVKNVVRDFTNSIKLIKDHGIILVHDLIPLDKRHTQRHLNGDGYKFLYLMCKQQLNKEVIEFYTHKNNCGLTMFIIKDKTNINLSSIKSKELDEVTYEKFLTQEAKNMCSHKEICLLASNIYDIIPQW